MWPDRGWGKRTTRKGAGADTGIRDTAAGGFAQGEVAAQAVEADGYDGVVAIENKLDPFLALALARIWERNPAEGFSSLSNPQA
jgi:hypothetical protein